MKALGEDFMTKECELAVQITNMKHEYNNFTLAIENVTLNEAQIIGLVGPNGAGKSTLMTILAGFLNANWCFEASSDYNENDILFIPSTLRLYDYLSVVEFVGIAIKQATKDVQVDFILDKLALTDKKNVRIRDLSQGMKKKLTLINMFTKDYKLLILDEPFNSIDMQYIYQLKQELKEISKGATVLVSSHILDTLSDLCDAFIYIKAGSVVKTFNNDNDLILEREIFEKNS